MKELILDIATWKCGGDGENNQYQLGEGHTQLLNSEGYMCCLGQWSLQLNDEVVEKDIRGHGEPCEVKKEIPLLVFEDKIDYDDGWEYEHPVSDFFNTRFSDTAMNINDDTKTTPTQKVILLRKLLEGNGYTLKTINDEILSRFPLATLSSESQ